MTSQVVKMTSHIEIDTLLCWSQGLCEGTTKSLTHSITIGETNVTDTLLKVAFLLVLIRRIDVAAQFLFLSRTDKTFR